MSFSGDFEKKVNEEMHHDGQPGRAPAEFEDADMALKKKGYPSSSLDLDVQGFREKKDLPPRFSTIFETKSSAPPPPPPSPMTPREHVRERYPEPRRSSGIHMPLPLFILLAGMLFFESTIIFAYTIIGLYNNAPSRLFPWAGQGAAVSMTNCDCTGMTPALQQPAINIAPNFVIPGGNAGAVTEMITVTATPSTLTTSTPSTSSSSTTISSSSSNASSQAAAIASNIADILGGLREGAAGTTTSSSSLPIPTVTALPEQSTVTSVTLITKDISGNVIPPAPTTTLTTFVDPPTTTRTTQPEIIIRPITVSSSTASA